MRNNQYKLANGEMGTWSQKLAELKAEVAAQKPSVIEAALKLGKAIKNLEEMK